MGKSSPLAQRLHGHGEREHFKRPPLAQQVPPGESLHEVGLPLVLLGLGGLPRPALTGESHEPALILGVLERRVVVLQNDLSKDAVFASSFPLGERQKGRGESELFWRIPGKRKLDGLPRNEMPIETLCGPLKQI